MSFLFRINILAKEESSDGLFPCNSQQRGYFLKAFSLILDLMATDVIGNEGINHMVYGL